MVRKQQELGIQTPERSVIAVQEGEKETVSNVHTLLISLLQLQLETT